jgi:hypothetical protein
MKQVALLAALAVLTAHVWGKDTSPRQQWDVDDAQQLTSALPKFSPATTTKANENIQNTPRIFAAAQNYPNPFNSSTTIEYILPQEASVYITIYNILGQPVRTLVNTLNPAGHHEITWDGRNDAGELVTSGVYFYRFIADDFHTIRKMLLLK